MDARVPPRTVATVALAALGLALVVVAAASGPVGFVDGGSTGTGVPPPVPTAPPTSSTATPSPSASQPLPFDPSPVSSLVAALVSAVVVLAAVVALVILLLWLRRAIPRWRSRAVSGSRIDVLPEPVPDELAETADHRMDLLLEGPPRNAIVACWLDLEESAAAVGLARDRAETSAEYTRRVLDTWQVAPTSMSRLAALYREARFSRHDLSEEHRAAAITALDGIHAELRRVAADLTRRRAERAALEAAAVARERGALTPGGPSGAGRGSR